jgi:hypothetical protein
MIKPKINVTDVSRFLGPLHWRLRLTGHLFLLFSELSAEDNLDIVNSRLLQKKLEMY